MRVPVCRYFPPAMKQECEFYEYRKFVSIIVASGYRIMISLKNKWWKFQQWERMKKYILVIRNIANELELFFETVK